MLVSGLLHTILEWNTMGHQLGDVFSTNTISWTSMGREQQLVLELYRFSLYSPDVLEDGIRRLLLLRQLDDHFIALCVLRHSGDKRNTA